MGKASCYTLRMLKQLYGAGPHGDAKVSCQHPLSSNLSVRRRNCSGSRPSSPQVSFEWQPSWHLTEIPQETLSQSAHLTPSWKSEPQKLWGNKCLLFWVMKFWGLLLCRNTKPVQKEITRTKSFEQEQVCHV